MQTSALPPPVAGSGRALARRLDAERDAVAATLPAELHEPARTRVAALAVCERRFHAILAGEAEPALTPDALAAFFERSLDRKPVGAYYTQADVADYIVRATIIPAVLERTALHAPHIFGPAGRVWQGLTHNPQYFLFADLRHGLEHPLPPAIAAALDDAGQRAAWDTLAPPSHALANETWREVVTRRGRAREVAALLASGSVTTPAALVTLNLDIVRVAEALITACSDATELQAVWLALTELRVLDPTCGAGAFLLAAARALQPLYHACLAQIESCLELAAVAREFDRPPGRAARVLEAIVARNLHAVDLLPEAATVCRIRLALELAATGAQPNLPATIHAGDALLGFAWEAAFPEVMARGGFDVVVGNPPYLVLARGEQQAYKQAGYRTATCGNLYALVVERSLALLRTGGRLGMIVPIASVATDGMAKLQELYAPLEQWHSHYAVRPARLFAGVDMNLTISLLHNAPGAHHTTGYRRWSGGMAGEREQLFTTLAYTPLPAIPRHVGRYPKLGAPIAARVLTQLHSHGRQFSDYVTSTGTTLFYHSGGRYWRKALPHKLSSHYKPLTLPAELAPLALCLLNSQLFYWYWIANSNCMDLVSREVLRLPVFALEATNPAPFGALAEQLLAIYMSGRQTRVRRGVRIKVEETNFAVAGAWPVIDAIDALLAQHYGLGAEELDFVRSYDIKYRAGLLRIRSGREGQAELSPP